MKAPCPRLIQDFLDHSAENWPDKVAFEFRDSSLTYAEVVRQANKLANYLMESGVKPSDRVGIYLNKSLEIPVAVYGILKAGAAFVPIDPGAPPARVAFLVSDCGIEHIVTLPERRKMLKKAVVHGLRLKSVVGLEKTDLEDVEPDTRCVPWSDLEAYPDTAPSVTLSKSDLAYILFTSGSTGIPKGMMHTHASGIAYALYSGDTYGIQPTDRMGNHSRLHFDMSLFEFFTGPSRGATTVIIPEEAMLFPASLSQLIEEKALTIWFSVPLALIQLMTNTDLENSPQPALRWVIYAGEPFPTRHLKRLMSIWPKARYSNVYGPAEVNQCTVYNIDPKTLDETQPVPLGKVWQGASGRVERPDGSLAGIDEIGELLINSSTMMKGYWGQPELTARGIVMREMDSGQTGKFYRTGDLVRHDPQGLLHFHGRMDRQVKIRGYRIELDEVEHALHSAPGVEECAIVVKEVPEEDKHLVAVIRLQKGYDLDPVSIRRHMSEKVPAYSIPEMFKSIDRMPETATGKINRRKLSEFLDSTDGSI